jgi:hypothetical protein
MQSAPESATLSCYHHLASHHQNKMLNRELLLVRLKHPFVDWINEADPYPDRILTTLESANEDCPVFLIHDLAYEDIEG